MNFIKDVTFLLIALGLVVIYNIHGKITIWMGGIFLVIYFMYLLARCNDHSYVVITLGFMRQSPPESLLEGQEDDGEKKALPTTATQDKNVNAIVINTGDNSEELEGFD